MWIRAVLSTLLRCFFFSIFEVKLFCLGTQSEEEDRGANFPFVPARPSKPNDWHVFQFLCAEEKKTWLPTRSLKKTTFIGAKAIVSKRPFLDKRFIIEVSCLFHCGKTPRYNSKRSLKIQAKKWSRAIKFLRRGAQWWLLLEYPPHPRGISSRA